MAINVVMCDHKGKDWDYIGTYYGRITGRKYYKGREHGNARGREKMLLASSVSIVHFAPMDKFKVVYTAESVVF